MATLPLNEIGQGGRDPAAALVAVGGAGDKVLAGPGVFICVRNTNGATRDVTIDDPTSVAPANAVQFNPDVTVTIPITTGERWIPVPARFGNPADGGLAAITYSATAGLTVGAFRISTT